MVKTLRITSVLAVLLAIAICTLLVKYGVKDDQNIKNFLNAPAITDVFRATSSSRPVTPTNQVHPLIQQAEAFALILNPPKPTVDPRQTTSNQGGRTQPPISIPDLKPKLELISTSYFAAKPELSMALINEPGKGRSWVMQSSEINHLLVKEVKDGILIITNGDKTYEYKTPEKKFDILVPIVPASGGRTRSNPKTATSSIPMNVTPPITRPARTSSKTIPEPTKESEEERMKRVEDLFLQLKMISDAGNSDSNESPLNTEERTLEMQKLIDQFKNANGDISDEDSEKLNDLGDFFNEVQDSESEN